ncbi:competence type IV pilus minor pilin ComGF [Metabacillus herbersteinensis]|uniref:Competence type IV pilus minor pilin ComGF n=1 Tax=Metabacillus herbersteinensis TaxID=283816 RepID=A0ABV6G9V1_9BACI
MQKHVLAGKTIITKRKNSVSLPHNNQAGYSFINLLLSLVIYFTIISSFALILHFVSTQTNYPDDLKPFEWDVFLIQLQRELSEASNIETTTNELTFQNNQGETVTFHQYQDLLRRQVEGRGHEIVLLQVKESTFTKENTGVTLKVVSTAGKNFTFTFRSMKELN